MNKVTKCVLCVVAIVAVLGIAGRCDYNEAVIYNMPEGVYQALKAALGEDASESSLVDEYVANRAHWDSVGSEY